MAKKVIDKLMLNGVAYQTAYDSTLTIQKNGTTVDSVNLNSSSDKTINIQVPDAQIQSDWNQTTTTALDYIKNKPTIPAAQIQSDWNQTTNTAKDYIKNKPTLGTAAALNTGTSSGNIPVLDSNGKIDSGVLPSIAITDTFTVSTTAGLTGLTDAKKGDIAIVTGDSETYILTADPYSTAANWKKLATPTDAVTSVNTRTGAVTVNEVPSSGTTGHYLKKTASGYEFSAAPVTSVNGSTGAVTVTEFTPGTGSTGQILTKTSTGYGWADNVGAVSSVNGETGAVVLDADDISDSSTTNKFVTSTEKTTWNNKADTSDIGNATITFNQAGASIGTLTTNQSSNGTINIHDNIPKTQSEYDNLPSSKTTDGNTYLIYTTIS